METVAFGPEFPSWQRAARTALARELPPEKILWRPTGNASQPELALFPSDPLVLAESPAGEAPQPAFRVPAAFVSTAKLVACHRDDSRWSLLYRLLWRLTHGEPQLLAIATDSDVIELEKRAKDIRRDVHKMRAFVRFREIAVAGEPWFIAWFEPHHLIVELNAGFFRDRFASMNWSIFTPDRCVHWDRQSLSFTPGVTREEAPAFDATEDLWRTYYRNIFNPARVKVGAMKKEMATYYWPNLPEARLIPELLAEAPARAARMVAQSDSRRAAPEVFARAPVPDTADLGEVRTAAATCQACPLWRNATCTVFGEGPRNASVLVVGEQPGDQEDRAGQPFVGPAGKLLDRAFAAAGVIREKIYLTNAVKHFKWTPQGKRRLHQKPNAREIAACRPWLEKEIALIKPSLIVCLGATAAQSVLGAAIKVTDERGRSMPTVFGIPALITVHPSALLRQPDASRAESDFAAFVNDLSQIAPLAS